MRQQTSAIVRLQSLPPIFRGADLTIRFQWTSKAASQYLYLWKRRGLVQGLGGHSDVYANLLTNPRPDWEKAVLTAMPSAVAIGIEALRQAGWTTQVPHRPSVAVNARQSVFNVAPFEIVARDPKWFEAARSGIQGDRALGLPVLRPSWALADMLRTHGWGKCGLWPDDIDWDEIGEQDEADWQAACTAFGMACRSLQEQAVASR
ncbi:hypothetical protein E6C76_02480 [Pseudothauera nasutitermitis]|uniref:Uncharacterized protein n=1 Tax=Pseudothauera nasutitermitis TaxID=2565930 RepID=A0A4S4B8E0_9RHOO|nr:hypothetical protein [Pseudothauera nasutitermitis]THF67263.1 hypothetical protein E6C76_02480 [Pseudothauera nasutitermitis]